MRVVFDVALLTGFKKGYKHWDRHVVSVKSGQTTSIQF